MTAEQRTIIADYRRAGIGYKKISRLLGINENTVKAYCKRNGLSNALLSVVCEKNCPCCGKRVEQNPGRRAKKFCSDECRRKWWNSHTEIMKKNAVCARCGKPFHGRAGRKYCCHACYIADRFGDGHVS